MRSLRHLLTEVTLTSPTFFYHHPIVLYQSVVIVCHPTLSSLLLLIVGTTTSLLFTSFLVQFYNYARIGSVSAGFLKQYPDCVYKRYRVSDYLPTDVLEAAKNLTFLNIFPYNRFGLKNKIDDFIKIYTVKLGSKVRDCPQQFASYPPPVLGYGRAYIFIRDEPEKIRTVGKFFIYHEVGHTLMLATFPMLRIVLGSKTFLFFGLWAGLTLTWKIETLMLALAFTLVLITLSKEWQRRSDQLGRWEEVAADGFAIQSLNKDERERVDSFFQKYPFNDQSMSVFENQFRNALFHYNIRLANEERLDYFESIPLEKLPFETSASLVLITLLGFFSKAPSVIFSMKIFLFVTLSLLFLLILAVVITAIVESYVDEILIEKQT